VSTISLSISCSGMHVLTSFRLSSSLPPSYHQDPAGFSNNPPKFWSKFGPPFPPGSTTIFRFLMFC
jgi:hypothetical protein